MRASVARRSSNDVEHAKPTLQAVTVLTNRRTETCIDVRIKLIERYRKVQTFGEVPWESSSWDVTDALTVTKHAYRPRIRCLLHFTQHKAEGKRIGQPFPNECNFADVVKALVCRRHSLNPVTPLRMMVYVRAWRHLHAAMRHPDISTLNPATFNVAALTASRLESKGSAYTVHCLLEEIATTLDDLRLVKIRLRWKWAKKKRPSSHGGLTHRKVGEVVREDKRTSDDVIFAIAQLYRTDPRSDWPDRMCVLVATILICTGLRLGQALSLRAEMPIFDSETGEYYIRLVAFKRAPSMRKTLLSETVELMKEVFRELLDITAPCREAARWLAKNPGKVYLLPEQSDAADAVPASAIREWLGVGPEQFQHVRKRWEISGEVVSLSALHERLKAQRFDSPAVPGTGDDQLLLADSLTISFFNGMNRKRTEMRHVVRPVTDQHVSDCLRGRRLSGGRTGETIFDRHDLKDKQGAPLSARSHGFRHKLNDALDKGGAPDLIQAQWFGRANPRDNNAYQYRTADEQRERARALLAGGYLRGRYEDLLKHVAPEQRQEVVETLIQVAHPTAGGYCLQNFAQVDCEHCGQCVDDCPSFHWAPAETDRKGELLAIRSAIMRKVKIVLKNTSRLKSDRDEGLALHVRQLKSINRILKTMEDEGRAKQDKGK